MVQTKSSIGGLKKIMAILNPFSGTKDKKAMIPKLHSAFSKNEYDFRLEQTKSPEHAKDLAAQAVKSDYDLVIAIGGDGTINEIASSLRNTDVKLAIISMGSGNGFARHLGMHKNFDQTIELIKNGCTATIDTCTINDVPFINLAGIGFDAKIAYLTKGNTRRGLWQYVRSSLLNAFTFKPLIAECCFDDKCFTGEYKTMVVANASLYGYNFSIAPLASLKDGEMDIMLFKNASVWKYFMAFPKFISNRLHKSNLVETFKTKTFKIILEEASYFHVDGEGFTSSSKEFNFKIFPKSLTVIVDPSKVTTI